MKVKWKKLKKNKYAAKYNHVKATVMKSVAGGWVADIKDGPAALRLQHAVTREGSVILYSGLFSTKQSAKAASVAYLVENSKKERSK